MKNSILNSLKERFFELKTRTLSGFLDFLNNLKRYARHLDKAHLDSKNKWCLTKPDYILIIVIPT